MASSGTAEAIAQMVHAASTRRAAADLQLLRVHRRRAVAGRRRADRPSHGGGADEGARPGTRTRRHHRRRGADPRDGGDDVRGPPVHLQRGRAPRRGAARHDEPAERGPGRPAPPPARRLPAQHLPARRSVRRRPRPLRPRRPPRRRAVRRPGAAPRARPDRPRVPGGRRAARQRRARRRPQQAPPPRLLRHPQQRAGRADRRRDRGHRPDRPVPPQERAQAVPPRLRRPPAGASRTWCGRWRRSSGSPSASTAATKRRSATSAPSWTPIGSSSTSRVATGADISLELYAANERKELLETVLGRRIELTASSAVTRQSLTSSSAGAWSVAGTVDVVVVVVVVVGCWRGRRFGRRHGRLDRRRRRRGRGRRGGRRREHGVERRGLGAVLLRFLLPVPHVHRLAELDQALELGRDRVGDPDAAVRGRVRRDLEGTVHGDAVVEVHRVEHPPERALAPPLHPPVVARTRRRASARAPAPAGSGARCRPRCRTRPG